MAASEKKGKTIRSEARELVNHVNPRVNEKQWKKKSSLYLLVVRLKEQRSTLVYQ